MAAIAAAAGVDRRTIYRRFASREELLRAVYRARLDAHEALIEQARLDEAPVLVALHRYAEGGIELSRNWPIDLERMAAEPAVAGRRDELNGRVDAFMERAAEEGLLRPGLPPGWAAALLRNCLRTAAQQFPQLPPAQAADLAVATVLHGVGAGAGGAVPGGDADGVARRPPVRPARRTSP
jgi:AcrR family transcriptional regulator